jgi:alpha-beta hydrolase superfamily lysophospholipase
VLFLVHGSSAAAMASYDLQVPGQGHNYSMMDAFAGYGFDVWTMDHEGYGKSARTSGNSDIASGVADLLAASELIRRETGAQKIHMFGESSGALRAGAFAMAYPDRVGRLILEAFTWTGAGSPTLGKRAEALAEYRAHNRRKRDRAMLESIFTRDHPGTTDPAVAASFVAAEIGYGDSVPSGTYLDMTANLPVVDPLKVTSPVLMVRGEYDGIAALDDLLGFYARLPNPDRQFAIIAGAAHSVTLSLAHQAMFHVVNAFLTMPAPPPA